MPYISAFVTELAIANNVPIQLDSEMYCHLTMTIMFSGLLCSTLLVVSMTFDRFYSILMPHKAASFNTVKRAKITIACICAFSIIYNVPQILLIDVETHQCVPYGRANKVRYGMVYYWFSFVINYALPFLLLLAMNSLIIHRIRQRHLNLFATDASRGQQKQVQDQIKVKRSTTHRKVILLLFYC